MRSYKPQLGVSLTAGRGCGKGRGAGGFSKSWGDYSIFGAGHAKVGISDGDIDVQGRFLNTKIGLVHWGFASWKWKRFLHWVRCKSAKENWGLGCI